MIDTFHFLSSCFNLVQLREIFKLGYLLIPQQFAQQVDEKFYFYGYLNSNTENSAFY